MKIDPPSEGDDGCDSVPPGQEMNNDLVSPDYDCDAVGWSKNIVIMSPKKEAQDTITNMEDKEEGSKTPDIINEENTPIKFPLTPMGVLAPVSAQRDTPLSPPSTSAEIFRRTCLQSSLKKNLKNPGGR